MRTSIRSPRTHVEAGWARQATCNSSTQKLEMGFSGPDGSQVSHVGELWVQLNTLPQWTGWRVIKETCCYVPHTWEHTYTFTWHTHVRKINSGEKNAPFLHGSQVSVRFWYSTELARWDIFWLKDLIFSSKAFGFFLRQEILRSELVGRCQCFQVLFPLHHELYRDTWLATGNETVY